MKQKLKNVKKEIIKPLKKIRRLCIKESDFSIISDNCWGGFMSQYFGVKYNSPFVGLFIFSDDYIFMLDNLDYYLSQKLIFIEQENSKYKDYLIKNGTFNKYPIAYLGDKNVEIHFLHYKNANEAEYKWNKRLTRLNKNKLIIKMCDRDLFNDSHINKFNEFKFERKMLLMAKTHPYKCVLKLKDENSDCIQNEWVNFQKTVSPIKVINTFFDCNK